MDRRLLMQRMLLATGASTAALTRTAEAAPLPLLDEHEPAALALGYTQNAKTVDHRRYPGYYGRQSCANCALIAFGTAVRRSCSLFPGKLVSARGWCKSWVKRAR
jgi:hypothetical protein